MEEKEKTWPKLARFTSYDGINKVFNLNNGCCFWVEFVLSKRYWFIQRLVKHFYLNVTKIDARIALSDFNATDRMLMALAISEDPITLLVDCLK